MEPHRALLPVGYQAGVEAYRKAAGDLSAGDLTHHYSDGLSFFHETFVPHVKRRLEGLSGGKLSLGDFVAYAAGSDVDLMTHLVRFPASAAMYPGDWYGFQAGLWEKGRVQVTRTPRRDQLACLCVPSVRNGHLTGDMIDFLARAEVSLLNVNLFPTLTPAERAEAASHLAPILDRALISVSFSRGFGLTASQLGVLLIHRDHPWRAALDSPLRWLTYFYNQLAARAFMAIDLERLAGEDERRRGEVSEWLARRGLPDPKTGTYYVRAYRLDPGDDFPRRLRPLDRDGVIRLCFKPGVTP